MDKQNVVVVGYGVVFPDSHPKSESTVKAAALPMVLPRKIKRFAARSTPAAFGAIKHAGAMAGIDLKQLNSATFGLYCSQSGFQHPDIDDLSVALNEFNKAEHGEFIDFCWNSNFVNPFLTVQGLNNNLLAMVSLAWEFRGDCGAFAGEHAGAASALDEARFNIENHYCDTALVVAAGIETDRLRLSLAGSSEIPEPGAVALLLKSEKSALQEGLTIIAKLSDYRFTYKQDLRDEAASTADTNWGGIVLNLVKHLALMEHNSTSGKTSLYSQCPQGLSASLTVEI